MFMAVSYGYIHEIRTVESLGIFGGWVILSTAPGILYLLLKASSRKSAVLRKSGPPLGECSAGKDSSA